MTKNRTTKQAEHTQTQLTNVACPSEYLYPSLSRQEREVYSTSINGRYYPWPAQDTFGDIILRSLASDKLKVTYKPLLDAVRFAVFNMEHDRHRISPKAGQLFEKILSRVIEWNNNEWLISYDARAALKVMLVNFKHNSTDGLEQFPETFGIFWSIIPKKEQVDFLESIASTFRDIPNSATTSRSIFVYTPTDARI